MRDSVGRAEAPVLIDQEGGRVRRLRPPLWPSHPAAGKFGELARHDPDLAEQAVERHARGMAAMLAPLGIDVDAAPVLDLGLPSESQVIGDRAYAADPGMVGRLGRAACRGLLAGGVLPIVKHLPGHGRAQVDSHKSLPIVEASWETLDDTDFVPFRANADMPLGMTGHILFTAIDPERPATLSATVVEQAIRGAIGFDGLLFSDDLSMQALSGTLGERAAAALAAGCDVALHCNGVFAEMEAVAAASAPMTDAATRRWEAAIARRGTPELTDAAAIFSEVEALLARA